MFLGFVSCSFPTNVVRKVRTSDEALRTSSKKTTDRRVLSLNRMYHSISEEHFIAKIQFHGG